MKVRTYDPGLLGAIEEYWNRSFRNQRNFWPITAEEFRRRVVERRTAVEAFDPGGLVVAEERGRVVGMAHVGVQPEVLCQAAFREWPGGDRGYLAFLHVEEEFRRRGIGTELWHRARKAASGARVFAIDTECLNPFYGNSEGPFTPFWGTPEGIGIPWREAQAKAFLAHKGYAVRTRAVQMEWRPDRLPREEFAGALGALGLALEFRDDLLPELGTRPEQHPRCGREYAYECALALEGGVVRGMVVVFPMPEVGEGVWGIYEAAVEPAWRGRGVGRALVGVALARLRERRAVRCDVVTVPEDSPGAVEVYRRLGFEPVEEWCVA